MDGGVGGNIFSVKKKMGSKYESEKERELGCAQEESKIASASGSLSFFPRV